MTSQDSSLEQLQNIFSLSENDIKANLEDCVQILVNCVKSSDESTQNIKALNFLLSICAPLLQVTDLEDRVLKYALPFSNQVLRKLLNGVQSRLDDDLSTQTDLYEIFSNILLICLEILASIDILLKYILSNDYLELRFIASVPREISHILYQSFEHCHKSEKLYGNYFRPLNELLSTLFRKGHDIQNSLISIVLERINFECALSEDLQIILDVISVWGKIGECLTGLDVKTMADLWKAYGRLNEKYAQVLKECVDISGPISYLTREIMENLEFILKTEDSSSVSKTIKITSFILKVVIKLCECYVGYIGDSCDSLLNLLVNLNRLSIGYLELLQIPEKVRNDIERFISIGAGPLLNYLISDRGFVLSLQMLCEKMQTTGLRKKGFLVFCSTVLKKLITMSRETQQLWFSSEESNILIWTFYAVEVSHEELCSDLNLPGVMSDGQPKRMTDLYEVVLCSVCSFILQCPASNFNWIEKLLLRSILNCNIWTSLMSSDVWCLISRFTTSAVCYNQLVTLVPLHLKAAGTRRSETIFTKNLISRLYTFLSTSDKNKLVELYPPTDYPIVWGLFSSTDAHSSSISSVVEKSQLIFNQDIPSCSVFQQFLDMLSSVCNSLTYIGVSEVDNTLVDLNLKLWKLIQNQSSFTMKNTKIKGFIHLTLTFTTKLTHVFNSSMLHAVLVSVQSLARCSEKDIKLHLLEFLGTLATKEMEASFKKQIHSLIADLFRSFLKEKDSLVLQLTLEVFSRFAHVTIHPDIVSLTVKDDKYLQLQLTQYLQKSIVPEISSQELENFFKYQSSLTLFVHKCDGDFMNEPIMTNEEELELSLEPANKKLKSDVPENRLQVDSVINRIKEDSNFLMNYKYLTKADIYEIRTVCNKLQTIIK